MVARTQHEILLGGGSGEVLHFRRLIDLRCEFRQRLAGCLGTGSSTWNAYC